MNEIKILIVKSFVDVWILFSNVILNIIVAAIIFSFGFYLSILLAKIGKKVIYFLKIDNLIEKTTLHNFFFNKGIQISFSAFFSWIIKWTGILFSLLLFLSILNLDSVSLFVRSVSGFSIKAISSAAILFFGLFVSNFVKNSVLFIGQIFSLKSAKFIAIFSQVAVCVFSIVFSLVELQISEPILRTLFTAILAFIVIAGGISFGFAGKGIVGRFISFFNEKLDGSEKDNID